MIQGKLEGAAIPRHHRVLEKPAFRHPVGFDSFEV